MEPYEDPSWWYRVRFSVRERLRSGILRLRSGWLQILQTGVAACVAWFLAVLLLGLDEPTFAPIAAVISLGLAIGERGRRVVELTFGVAFGVVIADFWCPSSASGQCRVGSWSSWRCRRPCSSAGGISV